MATSNEALLYDPPTKEELVAALKSVADWYTIGLKLGVPIQDLDDIKTIPGGSQKKKEAMFDSWIQELRRNGEKPTWQHILNVLTKLVIEKPIQDIKRRYQPDMERPSSERKPTDCLLHATRYSDDGGDVPTMGELECLKSKDGKIEVKIIETVAPIWMEVAIKLDFKRPVIEQLECDYRKVADACRHMFMQRLSNEDFEKPLTWEMISDILESSNLKVYAKELNALLTEKAT